VDDGEGVLQLVRHVLHEAGLGVELVLELGETFVGAHKVSKFIVARFQGYLVP